MLLILSLSLFFILFINFMTREKELTSPTFAFVFPFALMCLFDYFYWKPLSIEIDSRTILVIFFGCLFFYLGTLLVRKKRHVSITKNITKENFRYKFSFLFFMIFFQLVTLYLTYSYLRKTYPAASFSETLSIVRDMTVVGEDALEGNFFIKLFNNISLISSFVFSMNVFSNWEKTKWKYKSMLFLNIFIAILISFSGGSRGTAILIVFVFLLQALFKISKKNSWKFGLPFKYFFTLAVFVIIIVANFKNISFILGQSQVEDINFLDYLNIYFGAQTYNLNDAIVNNHIMNSNLMFEESFAGLYTFLEKIIPSLASKNASNGLYFVSYGNKSMGNVFTIFYPFLEDFGYIGIIVMPFLMGILSQFTYSKAKEYCKNDKYVNFWNFLYSFVYYGLFFAFFGNKFFGLILSSSMVKFVLIYIGFVYFTSICSCFKFVVKERDENV